MQEAFYNERWQGNFVKKSQRGKKHDILRLMFGDLEVKRRPNGESQKKIFPRR